MDGSCTECDELWERLSGANDALGGLVENKYIEGHSGRELDEAIKLALEDLERAKERLSGHERQHHGK